MKKVILALLLFAPPLAAQQGFEINITENCMADAISYEERQYCVGAAARQCMEYLGDTAGLARCAGAEAMWWEARVNVNVERISQDESLTSVQVEALTRMQAAWQDYRDASCAFEQAFAEEQTASEAECLLWRTGDQAVLLEDYLPRN